MAQPEPSHGWELTLGRSIRDLRVEKGYTLTSLSSETGLSPSFLSQFERGLTRASLHSLALIASALGSSAAQLLAGAQQTTAEAVSFLPAHMAAQLKGSGGAGTSLVQGRRAMQPMLLNGGEPEFGEIYVVHNGDEFIHVIAGRVQFELIGEDIYDLGPGDSLYYRGGIKHRWRQVGKKECRFISVLMDN
jgi:transcriptional regulator with XRE-family HTH domain